MCSKMDKASSSLVRIDRQSSIENEPLTLDVQQIEFAREAALYVVNTRSIEEAFRIFTEGLQSAVRYTEARLNASVDDEDEEERRRCECSRTLEPRDIVSAPF